MNSTPDIPIDLQKAKQTQRNALRQEYWKKMTQPPSSPGVVGDLVFDSSHQRYFSMFATKAEYFRPSMWYGFLGLVFFIVPYVGTCYLFKSDRDHREHLIRTGQVAYKDRINKYF